MRSIIVALGVMLLSTVLWDAFEAIILPRRVAPYLGLALGFLRLTWRLRSAVAHWMRDDRRREAYLSIIGPLSLFLLLGVWATGLVAGFAMLHWGLCPGPERVFMDGPAAMVPCHRHAGSLADQRLGEAHHGGGDPDAPEGYPNGLCCKN